MSKENETNKEKPQKPLCIRGENKNIELIPGVIMTVYGKSGIAYDMVTGAVYDNAALKRLELKEALPYCPYMMYCKLSDVIEYTRNSLKRKGTTELPALQKMRIKVRDEIHSVCQYKNEHRVVDSSLTLEDWFNMSHRVCDTWRDAQYDKLLISRVFDTKEGRSLKDWFVAWQMILENRNNWKITNKPINYNWMEAVWRWYDAKLKGVELPAEEPAQELQQKPATIEEESQQKYDSPTLREALKLPPIQGTQIKDWSPDDDMNEPKTIHDIEPIMQLTFQFTYNWNFMADVIKLVDIEYGDMVTAVQVSKDGCTVLFTLEYKNMRPVDPRKPQVADDEMLEVLKKINRRASEYYMMLHKCAKAISEVKNAVVQTNVITE